MEPVQSIEIMMVYEDENISFNVEDVETSSILYDLGESVLTLFVTNNEKTVTEIVVPKTSFSSAAIIRT